MTGSGETRGRRRKQKRPKPPKERFVARMKRRGHEAYDLGNTLVKEPRAFPGKAGGIVKRSFRKMWQTYGGGFYAVGVVLTFAWLEVNTLIDEISAAEGVIAFFTEQLLEFVFRFSIQSLGNLVMALAWPGLLIAEQQAWGAVILVAGFALFDRLAKPPLSRWLFDGEVPGEDSEDPVEPNGNGSRSP